MPRKTRKKPAIVIDDSGEPPADAIRQALEDLGINRPYYTCRVVGGRLELTLYGGEIVHWPPDPSPSGRGKATES